VQAGVDFWFRAGFLENWALLSLHRCAGRG